MEEQKKEGLQTPSLVSGRNMNKNSCSGQSFQILAYLGRLQPDGGSHAKGEGSYLCPVCSAKNFKVDLSSGVYKNWSCNCSTTQIREALAPLDWAKPNRPKQRREWVYTDKAGNPLIKVIREDDGEGGRQIYQKSLQAGSPKDLLPQVAPYRYHDCLKALTSSRMVFIVEGEPTADALWEIGIPATTFIGGCKGYNSERDKGLFPEELMVLCPDRDKPGLSYMESIGKDYPSGKWVYAYPDSPIWNRLPSSNGADIADWIQDEQLTAEMVLDAIEGERDFTVKAEVPKDDVAERANKLKLDLQLYLAEKCPRSRLIMRGDICARYRISKQDFTEQTFLLDQENDFGFAKRKFGASELCQNSEHREIKYLINRYLALGESIMIAADPGAGKTNLVTDAIHGVLEGGQFLGEQCKKGRVLFISSDESRRTTERRFWTRGTAESPDFTDDNFQLWNEFDITQLSDLEQTLEDWRPDLVVVDSVTTICQNVGIAEKDPEFARYIYKLKTLLGRYGASSIIIHHANKDPLAKGLGKISGSARIPAAFWGVFLLEKVDKNNEDNPYRWLQMVKAREVKEFKTKLLLNLRAEWLEKGVFSVADDSDYQVQRGKEKAILEWFRKSPGVGFEFEELSVLGHPKATLYRILDSLVDSRMLTQRRSKTNHKKWVWSYGEPTENSQGDSPPLTTSENENEKLEANHSNGSRHSHFSETEMRMTNSQPNIEDNAATNFYRGSESTPPTPSVQSEEEVSTELAHSHSHSHAPQKSENDGIEGTARVSGSHSHFHPNARGGRGSARMTGTPAQCFFTNGMLFEVGCSVTTSELPGFGVYQIIELTNQKARLHSGHVVSIESLKLK